MNPNPARIQFSIAARRPTERASLSTFDDKESCAATTAQIVEPIPMPTMASGVTKDTPILLRNRIAGVSEAVGDDEKYRIDVAQRPESASLDAYTRVPVDQFGTALLRGMGWYDGCPVGLSNAAVVQPCEYIRRGDRIGLGANDIGTALDLPSMTRKKKRSRADDLPQYDKNGRIRHVKNIDEVLSTTRPTLLPVGSEVVVTQGAYSGALGVLTMLTAGIATVCLNVTQQVVSINEKLIRSSTDADREEAQIRLASANMLRRPIKQQRPLAWVVRDIRLRIVNESFACYRKKGRVHDLSTPFTFEMIMDDGNQRVVDLIEEDVETIVPGTDGSSLICVGGPYRGERCTLQSRHLEQGTATVMLSSESSIPFAIISVSLDHVTEICSRNTYSSERFRGCARDG